MTFISQVSDTLLLPQVLSAVIEYAVNKALSLSAQNIVLDFLDQNTLTVYLAELNFPLNFTVNVNQSAVAQQNNPAIIVGTTIERSDCTIYTSIKTLKKIKAEQQITSLIKAGELDVEGDIKVAQQFAAIAQQLEIDWQSELAKHIGDIPTHQLVEFGNKITKKLKVTNKQLESDITEYIVYEKRLVVTKCQLSTFNQQVNLVTQQVNNLSERMDKLSKRLTLTTIASAEIDNDKL